MAQNWQTIFGAYSVQHIRISQFFQKSAHANADADSESNAKFL